MVSRMVHLKQNLEYKKYPVQMLMSSWWLEPTTCAGHWLNLKTLHFFLGYLSHLCTVPKLEKIRKAVDCPDILWWYRIIGMISNKFCIVYTFVYTCNLHWSLILNRWQVYVQKHTWNNSRAYGRLKLPLSVLQVHVYMYIWSTAGGIELSSQVYM